MFYSATEVINIKYQSRDWRAHNLSNLTLSYFELWGIKFSSREGMWQGFKFEEGSPEQRICFSLHGMTAKRFGYKAKSLKDTFTFQGVTYKVGSLEHQGLMYQAMVACVQQCPYVKSALLETGTAKLIHSVGKDSVTLPGEIFAGFWMDIREKLRKGELK